MIYRIPVGITLLLLGGYWFVKHLLIWNGILKKLGLKWSDFFPLLGALMLFIIGILVLMGYF